MTPERWRRVTDLFHAALERPAADRSRFLEEATAGDEGLCADVSAMLAAHDGAGAHDVPIVWIAADEVEVEPGHTIGPYEVQFLIGSGGMGRVYRARDARLDRDVAIKVLPAMYAADTDRLRRFEQEARASGALTHPNLVTVHDVGTAGGRPYLVTEFLEGETLRERLQRGALPMSRACDLAVSLARGLAAAHAKGVVHRDLKPENVMITRDGRVKILDFGVAKLRAPEVRSASALPAASVETEAGILVGTAGYMAPEQIRGADADGRADVFALGAILFELLSGRRAFDRPTRADTLDATVNDDLQIPPAGHHWPPAVSSIVQRCLEKDPEARFQSAADLAFALETLRGTQTGTGSEPRRGGVSAWMWAVAAAVLLALGAALVAPWPSPRESSEGDQLARFALPMGAGLRFTGEPSISPDGTTIVYPANEGPVETQQLYIRRLDQTATVTLPGTLRADRPFFSPDGQWVGFWSDNKLQRTRVDGTATPVVICAVESFLGGTWTADDLIVFATTEQGLQQVEAHGGVPRPLTALDPARGEIDHHAPAMLPGERTMLVTVHEAKRRFRIDALTLANGARQTVVEDGFEARYLSTGHIVYASGTALFAAPFDLRRVARSGSAVQLLDGVWTNLDEGNAAYAVSDTGTLVFLPLIPPSVGTLAWVDREGNATTLPLEPREYWTPRLSPDARQMAVVVEEQGTPQIWVYHFDNGAFSRLTSNGRNWSPVWAHDGSGLFYVSERDGQWQLMRDALDGRAAAEVLLSSTDDAVEPGAASRDGRSLVYTERSPDGRVAMRVFDLERRQSTTIDGLPNRVAMPVISPDGRWLGFTGWAGPPSIFVRPFADAGPARQLIEAAGYTVWNRAGDRIYFRTRRGAPQGSSDDGIFEVPFDPRRGVPTGPERQLFRKTFADWRGVPGFDVGPDGRFLLVLRSERNALPRQPHVLLNVDDELKRRQPTAAR